MSGRVVVSADSALDSTFRKRATVLCPQGKIVLGGGAFVDGGPGVFEPRGVAMVENAPIGNSFWGAGAKEVVDTDFDWRLRVFAICATVQN